MRAFLTAVISTLLMAQMPFPQQTPPRGSVLKNDKGDVIVACGSPTAGRPSPAGECCPSFRQVYPGLTTEEQASVLAAYEQYCSVPPDMQLTLNCTDPTSCCSQASSAMVYYSRLGTQVSGSIYDKIKAMSEQCTPYTTTPPPTEVTIPPPPTGRAKR